MNNHEMTAEMQECIANCTECHNICVASVGYCLQKGGEYVKAEHIRTLRDCFALCAVSADAMLAKSPLHPRICGVCAEACERCAASCEKFGQDQQMKNCADMCRRCAQSCRIMAAV